MTVIIGIDYGMKRIGLAVGESITGIASPLSTVNVRKNTDDTIRAVIDAVRDYPATSFVVGLPLNMDDTEGPQAKLVRTFGDKLHQTTQLSVHYWDERLSSSDAEERLRGTDLTRGKKKARVDQVAAQIILQEYLDANG